MDSMKSKQQLQIGDVVKSLDFVGTNDCYYIGVVTKILSDGRFVADTKERVWKGEVVLDPDSVDTIFAAPLPGNHFFDDMAEEKGVAPRIQVIA